MISSSDPVDWYRRGHCVDDGVDPHFCDVISNDLERHKESLRFEIDVVIEPKTDECQKIGRRITAVSPNLHISQRIQYKPETLQNQ